VWNTGLPWVAVSFTLNALLSGSAIGATKRQVPWPSNSLGLDPRRRQEVGR
jgi:hypothetical protein